MSHSTKFTFFKRGSLLLGAAVTVLAAVTLFQTVVRIDPFAGLKKTSKEVDPNLGVRMEGVTIRSYEKDKLVTKASIDRLDVRQDKQQYDLYGVHNGMFYSTKGAFSFDAPRAIWNVPGHSLNAPDGGHVKDKNIDLDVPQFAFNSKTGDVHVPGSVNGKVSGGNASARAVEYNVNSGIVKAGHMRWEGNIALNFQDGNQNKPRTWMLEGDNMQRAGDIQSCDNGMATDHDIIVLADHIEQNVKTDVVTATGHVRYFSSKTNILCEKAVIERKVKKATLTGKAPLGVQMLMKAKEKQDTVSVEEGIPPYRPVVPDEILKSRPQAERPGQTEEQKKLDDEIRSGKNMRDYPTICYAEQVVYWYKKGERHAEITGNPQARQELGDRGWRQVWTKTAYYDGEKDTLKMVSTKDLFDTHMVNSIGDDFVTDWVMFSTKEGDEDYRGGHMKGTLMDYSDEVPPADKLKKPIIPPGDKGNGGTTGGGTGTTGGGGQKPPPQNRARAPLSGDIQTKSKKKG